MIWVIYVRFAPVSRRVGADGLYFRLWRSAFIDFSGLLHRVKNALG